MKFTVISTKDLKNIFPELSRTDKFKRKIDEVFEMGFVFNVLKTEPLRCFENKKGKAFNAKIFYKKRGFIFKKIEVENAQVTRGEYEKNKKQYFSIEDESTGSSQINNDTPIPTYRSVRFCIKSTTWAEILKFIGKLIKSEFTETCTCVRCGGTGFIPEFAHYADGICFECMGIGKWVKVLENEN